MIVLYIIYALGLGGSALDEIKADLETYVVDQARTDQIVSHLEEVENIISSNGKQLKEIYAEVERLNANYDSTDEQYASVLEKGYKVTLDSRSRILDQRFKMKKLMTREEWEAVFPPSE
jgi:predicted kinase